MEIVQSYWEILVALFLGVVTAVKLLQQTQELRKDVDDLVRQLEAKDTYTETVKLRAEVDVHSKQITGLWDSYNKLRDKINGAH